MDTREQDASEEHQKDHVFDLLDTIRKGFSGTPPDVLICTFELAFRKFKNPTANGYFEH